MMYPYMTLNDDTEITHSEMYPDGKVKVYIETPDETGGFHDAICSGLLETDGSQLLFETVFSAAHFLRQ